MSIIDTIQKFATEDVHLARLFERAQEYAALYLIAKQRQKGCDGTHVLDIKPVVEKPDDEEIMVFVNGIL